MVHATINESTSDSQPTPEITPDPSAEPTESFADLLSAFERSHIHKAGGGQKQQLQGMRIEMWQQRGERLREVIGDFESGKEMPGPAGLPTGTPGSPADRATPETERGRAR